MKARLLEMTEPQLRAIIEVTNDIRAMIGARDSDEEWKKNVRLIDRMLKKNGYERQYK